MATLPDRPAGATRMLLPALAAILAGIGASAIVLLTLNDRAIAIGFVATALLALGVIVAARRLLRAETVVERETDWSVAHALAAIADDALAVTDRSGRLVCANARYEALFGGWPTPPGLPIADTLVSELELATRRAWRDGRARFDSIQIGGAAISVRVERIGEDALVWRFAGVQTLDLVAQIEGLIAGATGDRLAGAGLMVVMVTPEGRVRSANRVFRLRAMGAARRGGGGARLCPFPHHRFGGAGAFRARGAGRQPAPRAADPVPRRR